MSIKEILNDLSYTIRGKGDSDLGFQLFLDSTDVPGLYPNSAGMTLENMIKAIKKYLDKYGRLLRMRFHYNSKTITELNTDIDFSMYNGTDGPKGFFAFEDQLTSLTCNEVTNIPPYFCYGSSSITSINFPKATSLFTGAFSYMRKLTSVNLPALVVLKSSNVSHSSVTLPLEGYFSQSEIKEITLPKLAYTGGSGLFKECFKLETIDLPLFTNLIGAGYSTSYTTSKHTFYDCRVLKSINIPKMQVIGTEDFYRCYNLKELKLPSVTEIRSKAFLQCSSLTALIINRTTPPTLKNSDAFQNSAIQKGTGYIYVPSSAVETYKTAENWSVYADQIKSISEYVPEE